jgi:2-keto-4-pentenoate hydratase/2-oxohepta-3-ene-1,7-dioic acid hydratase in catechol pathway
MKLVTFTHNGQTRVGAVVDNVIIDSYGDTTIPNTMLEFLQAGDSALNALQKLIDSGLHQINIAEVKLHAPIPRPSKYLSVGLNYADHINEVAKDKPEFPVCFNKQVSCIIGTGDAIYRPHISDKLDYEGELAVVIGKRCRYVPVELAHEVIAGFMISNDVTVRDWQVRTPTWMLGKSFDTCGPLGPWLVTADEVGNAQNLSLKTWVDDELRQEANTNQMLFTCEEIIAYISQAMTLEVGDIITTGTPSGVGVKMNPRGYLKAGQTVRVEIEKLGVLINHVIEEPADIIYTGVK